MNMTNDEQSYTTSVIIPAYNAEEYVGRAIDSVLAQTRQADEIIVVDDGSTDNTADVIKSYGSRVHCIRQENGGASVARNTGIEAATGQWIAFLDADDEWLPEKLQLQIEHLKRNPDLVWSCGNYYTRSVGGNEQRLTFALDKYASLLKAGESFDNYLHACASAVCARTSTVILKRKIFRRTGLFLVGQMWAQDMDMFLRIAYQNPKIGFISEPIAVYFTDAPGSITWRNKRFVEQRCELIERHLKIAEEYGRRSDFEKCAANMLEAWVRAAAGDNRIEDALEFVKRYGQLLAGRLKLEMRLRKLFPCLSTYFFDMYSRLKRSLVWHGQGIRPGTLLRLQALRKRLLAEIKSGSTILDVGSYDGTIADHLRKCVPGLDITVVDVDEAGLKVASSKGLKTCEASALEMPFEDGSIDVVLCLDVIEHVDDDRGVIREMSRVVKCRGKLILTTPKERGVMFPFVSRRKNDDLNRQWGHVRMGYSLEQLDTILKSNNLRIEKSHGYFNLLTRFAYWLRFISRLRIPGRDLFYRLAVRLEPYLWLNPHEHFIVCRKTNELHGQ